MLLEVNLPGIVCVRVYRPWIIPIYGLIEGRVESFAVFFIKLWLIFFTDSSFFCFFLISFLKNAIALIHYFRLKISSAFSSYILFGVCSKNYSYDSTSSVKTSVILNILLGWNESSPSFLYPILVPFYKTFQILHDNKDT